MQLLTVDEAAEVLKVSKRQVIRYVDSGKLIANDLNHGQGNRNLRVEEAEIERFLDAGRTVTRKKLKPKMRGIERFV